MDFLVLSRKCNAYASRYLLQPLFLDRLPSQYLLMIYTAYFLRRKYGCELIESRVLKIKIKNQKIELLWIYIFYTLLLYILLYKQHIKQDKQNIHKAHTNNQRNVMIYVHKLFLVCFLKIKDTIETYVRLVVDVSPWSKLIIKKLDPLVVLVNTPSICWIPKLYL